MPRAVAISERSVTSAPVMPPGVSGLVDSGSGARRVHNTKPSGRGAPEATPRLNGLPARQLCAAAMRMRPGAAIGAKAAPAPAPAAPTKRRRLKGPEVCILPLAAIAAIQHLRRFL